MSNPNTLIRFVILVILNILPQIKQINGFKSKYNDYPLVIKKYISLYTLVTYIYTCQQKKI